LSGIDQVRAGQQARHTPIATTGLRADALALA
jgi:hypothetical protein